MLRSMFGIGGSEIIVILVVALLFLGPDKLPDAAKTISKGIRDLKKQSRALQNQIESDEQIGGAIRDLKSALRGDDIPARPPVRREPPKLPENNIAGDAPALPDGDAIGANTAPAPLADKPADAPLAETPLDAPLAPAKPAVTLPPVAGDHDPDADPPVSGDELGHLIKPAAGTVAKKHG